MSVNATDRLKLMPSFLDMIIRKKLFLIFIALQFLCVWYIRRKDTEAHEQTVYKLEAQVRELRTFLKEMSLEKKYAGVAWDPALPIIYVVTPTYARPVQKAELTRLSQTFMLVQNLHWIVVEDADKKTSLVTNLLKNSQLNYTHLIAPTPKRWKLTGREQRWKKPRGVTQRNAALTWLRENKDPAVDKGVVYFADDDNTYNYHIFNEMRFTQKASVWPVGLVGGLYVEKPNIDNKTGRVVSWNSAWRPERKFPIDMAGFAVNLRVFLENPKIEYSYKVERGYLETDMLSQVTTLEELEPLAQNCTKVYVWHTRTQNANLDAEKRLAKKKLPPSNLNIEV